MVVKQNRRRFLKSVGVAVGGTALGGAEPTRAQVAAMPDKGSEGPGASVQDPASAIDFRYSPLSWQTAFCFPDDPHKSLVGERGELRYGHPGAGGGKGNLYFPEVVEFSLLGMEPNYVSQQRLEAPGIPIISTRINRPNAFLELTTFATNLSEEGRVDNVILEVRPRSQNSVHADPVITIRTEQAVTTQKSGDAVLVHLGESTPRLFLAVNSRLSPEFPEAYDLAMGTTLRLGAGAATGETPLRYLIRLPQEGQNFDKIQGGLRDPARLLATARQYWQNWVPFQGKVTWSLPGRYGEFLSACVRNILQAREIKEGRVNFQVGPTVYRGLWVADGHFLLEAARYLGYDAEAQQGLEATWAHQRPDGGVFAAVQLEHWKDTGFAMFSLVRQAELSQDWSYFRKLQPNVLRAVKFLKEVREKAKTEGSANGRYGLLARGFGDGGLSGVRSEFTNTIWALAGLKAATEAADALGLTGFEDAKKFYGELRSAFLAAARQEMRRHPAGFEYLPLLMKEDPQWTAPDEWDRPRPQNAQWALSHAVYPCLLFERTDPIVQGHIALMQACTQEDVPAETGWIEHGGLWGYNAAFVAHAYLWAGLTDWARRTFIGFLNHATPLYCWREEQPLQGSLVAGYIGDMPHNWASAECVLYLRHMLAFEDGQALRLLEGIGDFELAPGKPYRIAESPTRFGRVSLNLEPVSGGSGWRLNFERGKGPNPGTVTLSATLGSKFQLADIRGATFRHAGAKVNVQPESSSWQAVWKA